MIKTDSHGGTNAETDSGHGSHGIRRKRSC